ncbi:transglycosylase SLT domain-containing protein [uncultured Cellulomonas sp.]|uniref:transglycosylase SLT domain-containing protein n=1 Tax=uncultured Cellulomonas sp. TaxID=189682 RepID=UPI002621508D|nr:transglycosylase SLT domain-containing protein [uncultured Cellulomonas sp.]
MMRSLVTASGLGVLAIPLIAIIAALGVGGSALACIETSAGGSLAGDAPVPVQARAWVREAKAACPDLPEPWIAAVMAQESGFHPDAYADDSNGGTWGLLQMNASVWAGAYGHPWSADLDHNGVWDIKEGTIHASTGGKYLCARLAGVREIRADHPTWASSALPVLDALIIAHNAGESRLRTYPAIPATTERFIGNVHERVAAWSTATEAGTGSDLPEQLPEQVDASTGRPSDPMATSGVGCMPKLGGTGDVVVPPGTPHDVATAVQTALSYVGVPSGWHQLCDRLACRAYGYASSGYTTAKAHWNTMVAAGRARPGDTCPPLGSFVFWNTGRPAGHVSVVVQADAGCDPERIKVTANEVFDSATGNYGGVYLISFAQLNAGYLDGRGYLGWSDPVCQGAKLPAGTAHPAPSGR